MSEILKQPNKKAGQTSPESSTYKPSDTVAQNPDFKEFQKSMIKQRDKLISEVGKAFDKKLTPGSGKIDERAVHRMEEIRNKQQLAIHYFFKHKINEYAKNIESQNSNLKELATELQKSAIAKGNKRIDALKGILENKIEGSQVTNLDVLEVDMAIQVMESFEEDNPTLPALMEKVLKRTNLTEEDYKQIVNLINPLDMRGKAREGSSVKDPIKLFEATTAGAFIGSMDDGQRLDLAIAFMKTPGKKNQTKAFLDSMLNMGLFNKVNGETVLDKAKELNVITQGEYTGMITKLNNDVYAREAAEYGREIEKELNKFYKGRYARGLVDRMVGKPFWGILAMGWGAATLALNTMVAKGNPKHFGPYWYAGLAGLIFGTESAFGSLKRGDSETGGVLASTFALGSGPVSAGLSKIGDKSEKQEGLENNEKLFKKDYLNSPKEVRQYLDKGGFAKILELKAEISKDKNRTKEINVTELLKLEDTGKPGADDERYGLLNAMMSTLNNKAQNCTRALNRLSNLAATLKIKTPAEMKAKLDGIKRQQKGQNPT